MIPFMQDELSKSIIANLGISDLSNDEQRNIITQFGGVALKAATLSVLGELSESKRNEFLNISEAGNVSAIRAFLDREVPGHEEMVRAAVAEEVKRFREFQAA